MADLQVQVHDRPHGAGGDFVLDVDLVIRPGITAVVGRSGAGKSTLLGAIAGLVRPQRGRIALGAEVWLDTASRIDRPVHQRRVAYVFQGLALFPHMSALDNVGYGMPRGLRRRDRHLRARALLERVGVGHLADRRPATFSGGEAQRVALARALAQEPQVILLDEPFSALDRDLRVQLAMLVRGLVDELGVPLIHVTHSHGEVRTIADHAVRIERGAVVAEGRPADILPRRNPDHLGPAPVAAGPDGDGEPDADDEPLARRALVATAVAGAT